MWYVLKCWMFSFGAGSFSSSLDVLQGGLGINILQFYIRDIRTFFSIVKILQFLVIKFLIPIRIRIDLNCWIRIQIRIEINADPQH
jgi:hypothetical protein